jgi:hypothetical protein
MSVMLSIPTTPVMVPVVTGGPTACNLLAPSLGAAPSPAVLHMDFPDQGDFADMYQRNNKAKGRKNLRCFPACRHEGHVRAGYCGRPVIVRVSYIADETRGIELLPCAEFVTEQEAPSMAVGATTTLSTVIEKKTSGSWFTGRTIGSLISTMGGMKVTTLMVAFNKDNQGWNYTWHSHRQKKDTKHVLRIFMLAVPRNMSDIGNEPCAPASAHFEQLPCVAEMRSSPFSIYCRRKRPRNQAAASTADAAAAGGGAKAETPSDEESDNSEGGEGDGKKARKLSKTCNSSGCASLGGASASACPEAFSSLPCNGGEQASGLPLRGSSPAAATAGASPMSPGKGDPLAMLALAAVADPLKKGVKKQPMDAATELAPGQLLAQSTGLLAAAVAQAVHGAVAAAPSEMPPTQPSVGMLSTLAPLQAQAPPANPSVDDLSPFCVSSRFDTSPGSTPSLPG